MFSFLFRGLDDKLSLLIQLSRQIMATVSEFQAAFERVDAATTKIAETLRTISGQIGSMTADEEEAARVRLSGVADALEALAAQGPANPVPVDAPQ